MPSEPYSSQPTDEPVVPRYLGTPLFDTKLSISSSTRSRCVPETQDGDPDRVAPADNRA
jgi:hypothetical protein